MDDRNSEFYITNRNGKRFTVLVDTEDIYQLIEFDRPWHAKFANGDYYVCCSQLLPFGGGIPIDKIQYLHRWILNEPDGVLIDHANHDTLDNRKSNLRYSDRKTNAFNRSGRNKNNVSGYRNVVIIKDKIYVQIIVSDKNTKFGPYDTLEDAAKDAHLLREKYYGEFAGNT